MRVEQTQLESLKKHRTTVKDIKAYKGKKYLQQLIEEGEHEHQDFKFSISDARKIARSISAFANNSGGRLLIGVKDNGTVAGVRNEEDIFVVEQAAQMYCTPSQEVEFKAYNYENNIVVIVAVVAQAPQRPVKAQDVDGQWKAYFRVADENILAHELMLRVWERADSYQTGPSITISSTNIYGQVVSLLEERPLTVREIMLALHISQRMADNIVVDLVSMGLAEFLHTSHGFLIALVKDQEIL